jgi:hypothetical protein
MKNLIHTAVVTLFAASTAHAQQAVQWKVSDGGNGHWYGHASVAISDATFWQTQAAAAALGGHLPTISSVAENAFVRGTIGGALGLYHSPGGQWTNVTGEPVTYFNWQAGQPSSLDQFVFAAYCCHPDDFWADYTDAELGNPNDPVTGFSIEFSADCNGDGIVDYGQCHDGTLPDYNGNNVPDCCERGEACVVGNYPVQWRVEDGGNGHWYQLDRAVLPWDAASARAWELGGALATISSLEENRIATNIAVRSGLADVWLGGFRSIDQSDWQWIGGESFVFSNWAPGAPWDGEYRFMELIAAPGATSVGRWNAELIFAFGPGQHSIFEWSADCNSDGIVDYGQILQGQLADLDSNGVPDICQQPTCVAADIYRDFNVNGADLGILLSQWGPNTPLTESDLNSDGVVNGADLGILLSFWGACP